MRSSALSYRLVGSDVTNEQVTEGDESYPKAFDLSYMHVALNKNFI